MRRSVIIITVMLTMLGLASSRPAWSRDLFRSLGGIRTMDFGQVCDTVREVYHTFELQNVSDSPARLDRAVTSCNCIEVLYDQDSIAPGKVAKVTVALDLTHKKGEFEIPVNLFDNQKNLYYFAMKGIIVHCDSLSSDSMTNEENE